MPFAVCTGLLPTHITPSLYRLNPTVSPPTYTSVSLSNRTFTFLIVNRLNSLISITVSTSSSPLDTSIFLGRLKFIKGENSSVSFAISISLYVTTISSGRLVTFLISGSKNIDITITNITAKDIISAFFI